MKVFLTGGTGFIGGEVARQLRGRGDEVACLVRSPQKAAGLTALGCEVIDGDLGDEGALRRGMEGCEGVVHAAAMYEVGVPVSQHPAMWETNVAGSERVFKAALEAAVPKLVYISTCAAFGNTHHEVVDETYEHPGKEFTSYYEETKVEAHRIAKRMIADGMPGVIVQPGGVYGPDDPSQVADLMGQFFAGKLPLLPFPGLGLCLAHVEDTAEGILLALDRGQVGEAYVLAGPVTTMREALETIAGLTGRKAPRHAMPTTLLKAMTPIGPLVGKLLKQPPNLRELIASADDVTFWASHEKASRELGYSPRGLEEGFRHTLAHDERFPSPVAV